MLTTLGRHRALFRRWLPFGTWLLLRTDLPRVDVELVILRTAWNCDAWYEWVQHIPLARKAGLAPDRVDAIVSGSTAEGWTPRQRALLRATDELHRDRVIGDTTWSTLTRLCSDRELTELCFVVGHYELLAMTLNSLGVEPEPAAWRRLDNTSREQALLLRNRMVEHRQAGPRA